MEQVETIFISDYTGKQTAVEYIADDENTMQLDVSNLQPGYYILTVSYGFGKTKSKKLLIQD